MIMNRLIELASMLMGRLNYLQKFTLIFVLFLLPLGLVTAHLFSVIGTELDFLQGEQRGVAYLKGTRPLMERIPQYRGMTNVLLNGDRSILPRLQQKRREVEQAFDQLEKVDQELGSALGTGERVTRLRRHWDELVTMSEESDAKEAFTGYTDLIDELIELITHIGDTSSLILDPELDSYYLMDMLILRLPPLTNYAGEIRGLASGIAARHTITPSEQMRLAVLLDRVREGMAGLEHGIAVISEHNPVVAGTLREFAHGAIGESRKFSALVKDEILERDIPAVDPQKVFDQGTRSIGASFALYDAARDALDGILAMRVEGRESDRNAYLIVTAAVLLLLVLLFAGFYRGVSGGIHVISLATEQLAEGDLGARVELDTRDELQVIARSVNRMAENFARAIGAISASSEQVAAAAEELSAITDQASHAMHEQQGQTEQVATAMNEMSAASQEVSGNIMEAANAAREANRETASSRELVEQAVQAMESLAGQVEQAAGVIRQLEEDSEEINTVLDVIKGVADQTNLLALNAAIEAARAGEHGRGFAVVADEVRSLAGRTQESTKEINQVIEKLQAGTREAVAAMNDGLHQAQQVVQQATQAGDSLNTISSAVESISTMSEQIASAAEQQSTTAEEINRNLVMLAENITEVATGSQQTTTASEELTQLAAELQEQVTKFQT